jgi:signal transduction histidine kinase
VAIDDLLRSAAFRLAVVFALVVTVSTSAVFGFVYWSVARSDMIHAKAALVDEVAKGAIEPTDQLERGLGRRLTRDLRQIEYAGLFDAEGKHLYGNVMEMPGVPIDGKTHTIEVPRLGGAGTEPAIFVAQNRPSGGTLFLGRSLYEIYALRRAVLQALVIGIGPTVLLALLAGAILSLRAARRLHAIQYAINRVIEGHLHERLPVNRIPDGIDEVVRSVNLMLDEIARLMNQLKQVGDNIAHDLRTPLSIVRIRLERSLDAPEAEIRTIARHSLANLDRVLATVTALLRISEIESRLRRSAFAGIDLAEICREVFDFYEPMAEAKSITLTLDSENTVPFAGDADLFREALNNLVDNAIKFTPEDGSVCLCARNEQGGPLIRVSDSGPGIESAERDKIFKRFYRSPKTGTVSGNGLGLSMAAAIAELHGLTLRLGETQRGACFEIVPHAAPDVARPVKSRMPSATSG